MTTHKKAIDLIISAFYDYTSSRCLLINNHPLNGVILASLALEKYLKAVLLLTTNDFKKIHFDKIDELKKQFGNTRYIELFNSEPQFIHILSTAYRYRYFDNITQRTCISFVTNQLLAELDYFVNNLEKDFIFSIDGNIIGTPYQRAERSNDIDVYNSNYILNKINKKEFVERESSFFSLIIDPINGAIETILKKGKFPYSGKMTVFFIEQIGEGLPVMNDIEEKIYEAIKQTQK